MPKSHDAWVLVATWRFARASVIVTLNPILYVKVNGCVGVFVFGFFGDGESYIVKKSLSKINPIESKSPPSSSRSDSLAGKLD